MKEKMKLEDSKEKPKVLFTILILCLALLLPLFIISKYNRPCADDYDYSILTHEVVENHSGLSTGFHLLTAAWKTDISFYNSWQGLYISAFILSLQPGIFGEKMYALTTFIVLGICYLCLLGSIYILNKHFFKKSFLFCIVFSLTLLTVLTLLLPSPVEGLFWYNGALNYMPWVFATFFNLCLLIEVGFHQNKKIRIAWILVSTVLSFLISGANHVTAFLNILILLSLTIYWLFKKRCDFLLPLTSAIIGFGIVMVAPGTAIRQNALLRQSAFNTIFATIKHVYQLSGSWFSLTWLLSLLVITPFVLAIVEKNQQKWKNISLRQILFTLLIMIIILCGMFCVPYYAMQSFGAGRLTNVIWITFMIFSWIIYTMLWLFLTVRGYLNLPKFSTSKANYSIAFLSCLCLIALFLLPVNGKKSNSFIACRELLNHTASRYAKEMDERIQRYNDETLEVVEVKEIESKSKLLYFSDVGYSSEEWPNTSISKYYKKKIYKVEPTPSIEE